MRNHQAVLCIDCGHSAYQHGETDYRGGVEVIRCRGHIDCWCGETDLDVVLNALVNGKVSFA